MDPAAPAFARLVERCRTGDPDARRALYEAYGGVVREAVRRRLPDRLRKEYDSLDFAHDVWASFFHLPPDRQRFDTPEDLGGFLARVARCKVIDVCRRRLGTQGYDVSRERPLPPEDDEADARVLGRATTPSQVVIADERWEALAAALPAAHVAVLERLREGYTQREVAAMTGVTDRTVRRIVDRARELCGDAP